MQAVTPEPQLVIISDLEFILSFLIKSLILLFLIKYPFLSISKLKGKFSDLGICPFFNPGLGSSSIPLNLASDLASKIFILLLTES